MSARSKQQPLTTTSVAFQADSESGHMLLSVNPDVPIGAALRGAAELLDGLHCLLRTVTGPDGESDVSCYDIRALRFVAETAATLVYACSRGVEQAGGEVRS